MRELMSLSIEDRLKLQEFSNKHNKSHSIVQKVVKSDEEIEADKEDAFEKQVAALHEKQEKNEALESQFSMSTGGNDVNAGVDEDNMETMPEASKSGGVNDDLDHLIDQELN